jgi:hypothetical protein
MTIRRILTTAILLIALGITGCAVTYERGYYRDHPYHHYHYDRY